jgi:hypothetical protein
MASAVNLNVSLFINTESFLEMAFAPDSQHGFA